MSHRDFLRHYKRLTIFSLVFLYALQNTRLSFESIVCYTFENFPTKTINSINWNLIICLNMYILRLMFVQYYLPLYLQKGFFRKYSFRVQGKLPT